MGTNAAIAYISTVDPAYEMSDIRANFEPGMQAFHSPSPPEGGGSIRSFGISSINPGIGVSRVR